jgi:hypothetical protein
VVAVLLLVGLKGVFVAGLLAALLMFLSWVVRRPRRGPAQGPPSGPAGLASKRQAPVRQLPSARHDPWHMAEAARAAWLACGLVRFRAAVTFWPWTAVDSGGSRICAARSFRPTSALYRRSGARF